jgi:hypothetical protein
MVLHPPFFVILAKRVLIANHYSLTRGHFPIDRLRSCVLYITAGQAHTAGGKKRKLENQWISQNESKLN